MRDTHPHDYDTTLMGPGFFVFFQRGIIETGGYEPPVDYGKYHPYRYTPKVRFKFKEEEKKVVELIEEVFEFVESDTKEEDLELILRLQLQQQEILCKELYILWLEQEFQLYLAWKREQEAIILLLLH